MIKIKIAGLVASILNRYAHIERLAVDYITDGEPDFEVEASEAEIEEERLRNPEGFSAGYLESVVLHRKIAEQLPRFGALVFHAAVVEIDGRAYAFTAKSGTGKTTHTRHLISAFGDRARYVNGDKPIIRIIDGVPYAFGTPWRGKESYGENISSPLVGIAFLSRAAENSADVVDSGGYGASILSSVYIPKNRETAVLALSVVSKMLSSVTVVDLRCNPDPSSVLATARAFGIDIIPK